MGNNSDFSFNELANQVIIASILIILVPRQNRKIAIKDRVKVRVKVKVQIVG